MNFNMMQLFRTLVVTAFVPAALLSGVNVFAEQLHVRLRDNVELKSHVVCLGDIADLSFFELLLKKFKYTYPEFCIATSDAEDPIFLFNLIAEDSKDYVDLMINAESKTFLNKIGLRFGLSIMYDRIFFFHIDKKWCIYANQYYDKTVLAY